MRRTAACLLALTLLLTGCGEKREATTAPSPSTVPTQVPPANAREGKARIVVDAAGLSNGGAATRTFIRFGAPRVEADAFAGRAMRMHARQWRVAQCRGGPMEFSEFGPLRLVYRDSKFVGWFLRSGEHVVTSEGLIPGLALAQLREWRLVRAKPNSANGGELEYRTSDGGVITGLFEGSPVDGSITALKAGADCVFR